MSRRSIVASAFVAFALAVVLLGVAAAAAAPWFTTDIAEEAAYVVEAPGSVTLDPGTHQMWLRFDPDDSDAEGIDNFMSQVQLSVTDSDGNPVALEQDNWQDNFGEYSPYAQMTVSERGEFDFESDRDRTFYLTEPMDAAATVGRFVMSLVAALLVGGIGVALLVVASNRSETPAGGAVRGGRAGA